MANRSARSSPTLACCPSGASHLNQLIQFLGNVGSGAVPVVVVAAEANAHLGALCVGWGGVANNGDDLRVHPVGGAAVASAVPMIGPQHTADEVAAAVGIEPQSYRGA